MPQKGRQVFRKCQCYVVTAVALPLGISPIHPP